MCPHQWIWIESKNQYECVHCGEPITRKVIIETIVKIPGKKE